MTGGPELLVVGDVGVDLSLLVDHRPELDEKVFARHASRAIGGVALNTAAGAAALGANAGLVARVGADPFGVEIVQGLRSGQVDASNVVVDPRVVTYYAVSMIDDSGEKAMVVVPTQNMYPDIGTLRGLSLEGVRRLHTVPYDPKAAQELAERARRHAIPFSIDLELGTLDGGLGPLESVLAGADVVFVNTRAASTLGGDAAVQDHLRALGVTAVVFTRGEAGAVISVAGSTTAFAAPPVKAVDSTGAGDCFAGAYAAVRLRGFDPVESTGFACVAATLSCLGFGATAALPSFDEVLRHRPSISRL